MMKYSTLALALLSILVQGCSTITNQTPGVMPRDTDNLYRFEVAWDTNREAVRNSTIEPKVVLNGELYPMEKTPLVEDRWETLVPISQDVNAVNYRYKFDYRIKGIPEDHLESKLSKSYLLYIEEVK